jgi:hypothetical protein
MPEMMIAHSIGCCLNVSGLKDAAGVCPVIDFQISPILAVWAVWHLQCVFVDLSRLEYLCPAGLHAAQGQRDEFAEVRLCCVRSRCRPTIWNNSRSSVNGCQILRELSGSAFDIGRTD